MSRSYYLGCITGTSVDGLDLALVELADNGASRGADIHIIHATTVDLPNPLRQELLALGQPGTNEIERLGQADTHLGQFIGASCREFLAEHHIPHTQVGAIGSHGQTVRHRPEQALPFSLQIGDPNQIAEITQITTVADFRRRDLAAGGEGAPLVPLFHEALLGDAQQNCGLLNIGGIANLTGIGSRLVGFDTGPGNGLMDAWIYRHQQQHYDNGGAWAAGGAVDTMLLQRLLADPYFQRPAPKSTGKEHFNLAWLDAHLDDGQVRDPQDVQATLLELSVTSIANALHALDNPYPRLLVCGGGRLNQTLMQHLAQRLGPQQIQVQTTEALNIDGDSLEAAAFAWLACRRLAQLPGNHAAVTGAKGPRILGAVYPG